MSNDQRTAEFVQLFTKHGRWIYSYILTLVPHQADADDIYQTTSATLWAKFDTFEPGSNFRAWAFRVAQLEVLQFRRARGKSPALFGDAFFEVVDQALAQQAERLDELSWALEQCVAEQSDADRELLRRRYEPQATTRSVATDSGRSEWSIYRRLSLLHQKLLRCIRRRISGEET